MKTLTITSEIFANEWAESFLKAILQNEDTDGDAFWGYDPNDKEMPFLSDHWDGTNWNSELTFNLDELSVDWACISRYTHVLEKGKSRKLDLDYLAKQKGIEIK